MVKCKALFQALDKHAQSLKELRLEYMTPRAFASLDRLQNCTGLKTLGLRSYLADESDATIWASNHAPVYSRIVAWLQNCSQLKDLALLHLPSGSQLQDVLKSPNVRLTDLCYKITEVATSWYTSLHHQQSLRSLEAEVDVLELQNQGPVTGRCAGLAKGVSQLPELQDLIVNEYFPPRTSKLSAKGQKSWKNMPRWNPDSRRISHVTSETSVSKGP